jgi:hypothetical protein
MSSCWSATSRFSLEFSFSRSLGRLTASRSTAPYSARHRRKVTSDTPNGCANSLIGVALARASAAWRSFATASSARCRFLFVEQLKVGSTRPQAPKNYLTRGELFSAPSSNVVRNGCTKVKDGSRVSEHLVQGW